MGRKKLTDGSKLIYAQLPIMERDLKKIGKENLEKEFKKMVEKTIHNIDKGKVHNQINIIDAIAEIEKTKK